MKILLDTNVLLRFYLRDVEDQFDQVEQLFTAVEAGQHRPYISSIVLLEIVYVLERMYKLPRRKVLDVVGSIQRLRNLTVIEKTNSDMALQLFQKYSVKFADCLIASQVPKGMVLVSYDKDFAKLPVQVKKPAEL